MLDSRDWDALTLLFCDLRHLKGSGPVLVVEDETLVREGLADFWRAQGRSVTALEGVEADALPAGPFDLAFLDGYFISNTLTGVTLTPLLRRAFSEIEIVGISSDPGMNARMLALGANLCIPKSAIRRAL